MTTITIKPDLHIILYKNLPISLNTDESIKEGTRQRKRPRERRASIRMIIPTAV